MNKEEVMNRMLSDVAPVPAGVGPEWQKYSLYTDGAVTWKIVAKRVTRGTYNTAREEWDIAPKYEVLTAWAEPTED